MKIGSSNVSMASENYYVAVSEQKEAVVSVSGTGDEGKQKTQSDSKTPERASIPEGAYISERAFFNPDGTRQVKSMKEIRAALLDNLIEALQRKRFGYFGRDSLGRLPEVHSLLPGRMVTSGKWIRYSSSYYAEEQSTSFSTMGRVVTEDGREISFDITFSMQRSFETSIENYSEEEYYLCDPLVLSFGGDVAKLGSEKFDFDLDGDGETERISCFLGNSGFLALDKNNDGIINDGTELFGTASGDGFRDLAEYDEDGNGWIDENDSVFDRLKIWRRESDGTDTLRSLKEADVGAIYLGNVRTVFDEKDDFSGGMNGRIGASGIFLGESGGAGFVQHVDFAV